MVVLFVKNISCFPYLLSNILFAEYCSIHFRVVLLCQSRLRIFVFHFFNSKISFWYFETTMGGHHESEIKIPDYRIYKVDNVPDLVKVRDILAVEGLKDPWLRNEVWRYPPRLGSRYEQYFKCWFRGKRGLTIAFGLAATVIAAEKTYKHFYPPVHHHKTPYFPKSSV